MDPSPKSGTPSWLIGLAAGIAVGAVAVYLLVQGPQQPTPSDAPTTAAAPPSAAPSAPEQVPTAAAQPDTPGSGLPITPVAPPPVAPATPTRAAVVRDCDVCPALVAVPAGQFMMGAASSDTAASSEEHPQHPVKIGKPLLVGKYEVTFAEWDACVADKGCTHTPDDFGWGRDRRPVVHVAWDDAQQYIQWLRHKTGKPYRLLTEAEWEYVARAGTSTAYWWGDQLGSGNANCRVCGTQWDNRQTAPVGSFAANGFGVHDTSGNAWEWVEDCWSDDHKTASPDGAAVGGSGTCERRVLRGGSWSNKAGNLRTSARAWGDPGGRVNILGFRVARDE